MPIFHKAGRSLAASIGPTLGDLRLAQRSVTRPPHDVVGQGVPVPKRDSGAIPVKLAFKSLRLRTLCEQQAAAEREYGFKLARRLRARVAELRAAETVLELPAGRPREIPGRPFSNYAVNLTEGYRLVLSANHGEVPVLDAGGVDWAGVSRVMVVRIEVGNG